jgi:hypothetical protein
LGKTKVEDLERNFKKEFLVKREDKKIPLGKSVDGIELFSFISKNKKPHKILNNDVDVSLYIGKLEFLPLNEKTLTKLPDKMGRIEVVLNEKEKVDITNFQIIKNESLN